MPAGQRQHTHVLGVSGGLLRPDDVCEVRDDDL
jgi:hypothetical protein